MRFITALSFFFVVSAHANVSKVVCVGVDGYTFESTLKDLNVDGLYNGECEEKLFNGELCYKGDPKEVVRILKGLSEGELLGDELSLRNIQVTKQGIAYSIWDGPNAETLDRVTIKKCK